MKVLYDTSVLVAGLVEAHPLHNRVFPWIKQAVAREHKALISAHSYAELYSVLTSLPVRPRIAPSAAWQIINGTITPSFEVVALTADQYKTAVQAMAAAGLSGGAVYDAVIVAAARAAKADRLLTLNPADFKRIDPAFAAKVIEP
ncbi:MAG: PIN domain-containing protein [Planctomycetota bacterium]